MPKVVHDYGEVIRARNTYTHPDTGALVDPITVEVELRKPDLTITTLVYGTDPDLTKISTGVYQFHVLLDQTGTYKWRWTAGTSEGPSVDNDECDSVRKF